MSDLPPYPLRPHIQRAKQQALKVLSIGLLLLLFDGGFLSGNAGLHAQVNLKVGNTAPEESELLSSAKRAPANFSPGFQRTILPAYARANPTGYSFLCRLELDIERKSPIGVWMKIEESDLGEGLIRNRAYLQLKLLDF